MAVTPAQDPAVPTLAQGPYTPEEAEQATLEYFHGDQLQTDTFLKKYALRDQEGRFWERTPDDMHRRLAREFARIEAKYPNPLSEEEIYGYLKGFGKIVAQGGPSFGIGNDFQLVSLSNCSVSSSPRDDLSSIMDTGRSLATLYKRRIGAGADLSLLRPEGAAVNNAARASTGAWSFADLYSYITRMVGQENRRGALMLTLAVNHPDVERFVTMKEDPTKVTGANVSVRVSDEFMRAVQDDAEYTLRWPVDARASTEPEDSRPLATFERTVRARDLFRLIARKACENGEPGILFWDTIKRNLPLDYYEGFETLSTNPCSEIPLSAEDSCRLMSTYLPDFVCNPFTRTAYLDEKGLRKTVRVAMRLMDDLVDLELEKLRAIQERADTQDEKDLFARFIASAEQGRRTGLGTHGLGDMLARLGLRYGSPEAVSFTDEMYRLCKYAAYEESINLAEERGAFPVWDWETEKDCEFFTRMARESEEGAALVERMSRVGRRNGALLTNAPTGSISILSNNCSSGIEPVFKNAYKRRRKLESREGADYIDVVGDAWQEYTVYHKNVELFRQVTGHEGALPEYFVEANDVPWPERVAMQAAIQRHVDHALSVTSNLPRGTTVGVVESLYMAAWKSGCKGSTVYVDGSRDAQVLSSLEPEAGEEAELLALTLEAEVAALRERVKELESGFPARTTKRGRASHGEMVKAEFQNSAGRSRKVYAYVGLNEEEYPVEVFVTDERGGAEIHAYASALAIMISLALKHQVPAEKIASKLIGIQGDSTSFSGRIYQSVPDFVGKLLQDALDNQRSDQEVGEFLRAALPDAGAPARRASDWVCPSCGNDDPEQIDRSEKCPLCRVCGYSKCN